MNLIQGLLYPLAQLYGFAGCIRNKLYDKKIFRSKTYTLPIISIGNLTVGGTGKTPHTEYLIRLLQKQKIRIGTLSRGYGRKTKGFVLGNKNSTPALIGDEPCQFLRKYSKLQVAVHENRVKGIDALIKKRWAPQCMLLDDAFQHRRIKPGLSILLTDYYNPYYKDHLIPSGRLREYKTGAKRADLIIVTKCPTVLSPITRSTIINKINLKNHQNIFFSFIRYGELIPFFPDKHEIHDKDKKFGTILMFAGIANTYPLEDKLKRHCNELEVIRFADHHNYNKQDLYHIKETFCNIVGRNKIIVTSEKDWTRLCEPELLEILEGLPVYFQPIEVDFYKEDKKNFDNQILNYVGKIKDDG